MNATQLEDQLEATPGDNITFTVVAAGDLLMYTWQRNTVSLLDMGKFSGTNTSTLTITDVREEEEGMYRCVVSNIIRNVTSRVAQLTVCKYTCNRSMLKPPQLCKYNLSGYMCAYLHSLTRTIFPS